MNTRFLLLLLAGFVPRASAEPPEPTASTLISCDTPRWPTSDKVAQYLRIPKVTVGEINAHAQDGSTTDSSDPGTVTAQDVERVAHYIRKQGRRVCWEGAYHVKVDFYAHPDRSVAVQMQPR